MAKSFEFPIFGTDLPKIDALRLSLESDFWPEAAFAIFHSALLASDETGHLVTIPDLILERVQRTAARRLHPRQYSSRITVCENDPDPDILLFLRQLARAHRLSRAKYAALALIAVWAADPHCWPGRNPFSEYKS